ncbi:MAG: hypothetical protein R3Y50_06105 [Rikenellaceae bacterium]
MKTVNVEDNQTLLDIAMQYYGNAEAIGELLSNNPHLTNDAQSVIEENRSLADFYPDITLKIGLAVYIDDDSQLVRKTVVKKIDRSVNTYTSSQWQEQLMK